MRDITKLQTFDEYMAEKMKDPEYRKAYKALDNDPDIILMEAMMAAHKKGVTQTDIAKRMGTTQSAISRAFSANGNPTLNFLKRLAAALDLELNISFS